MVRSCIKLFCSHIRAAVCFFSISFFLNSAHSIFVDVDTYNKSSHNKKVLVFLSHKCTCSNAHISHLVELSHTYPEFKFFGVVSDKISEKERSFTIEAYESYNLPFPIIEDQEGKLLNQYKALKTPHVTIVLRSDKGEQVAYQGGITDSVLFSDSKIQFLSENLKSLRLEGRIKYKFGRSLGCYIRRI